MEQTDMAAPAEPDWRETTFALAEQREEMMRNTASLDLDLRLARRENARLRARIAELEAAAAAQRTDEGNS